MVTRFSFLELLGAVLSQLLLALSTVRR